jgi:hypothetical protein
MDNIVMMHQCTDKQIQQKERRNNYKGYIVYTNIKIIITGRSILF